MIVAETEGLGGIPIIAIAHLMSRVVDCFRTSTDIGPVLRGRARTRDREQRMSSYPQA